MAPPLERPKGRRIVIAICRECPKRRVLATVYDAADPVWVTKIPTPGGEIVIAPERERLGRRAPRVTTDIHAPLYAAREDDEILPARCDTHGDRSATVGRVREAVTEYRASAKQVVLAL